ncbi:hypothetical protein SpCBS45565_g05402 [Spizellomyces sp. 'palustris']|nr:hypothetical protein SpCBS45565_g05402 [Spizellomyces sp. 'palustris']
MQHIQQIIAGKSNTTLSSIATGVYRGTRYVIYASGANCIVYTATNEFVQILRSPAGDEEEAAAVAFGSDGGCIAVSFGDKVLLFKPREGGDKIQWNLESTLTHPNRVRAISWNTQGELLVAGRSICLWERKDDGVDVQEGGWIQTWSVNLASEVAKAEFSPDGHFFATFGEFDRLVKVWNKVTEGHGKDFPKYNFVYLPHARSVINMEWRRTSKHRLVEDNVLMTISRDNICRLWCPVSETQPYEFHLAVVIDPTDFPLTEDPTKSPHPHICAVHWLHSEEIQRAIKLREQEEKRFTKKNSRRKPGSTLLKSRKLKDAVKDYSEILFHVQSDGAMIVWGVQHLTGRPRRMAKVIVLMKTDRTVASEDFDFFEGNVTVFHNDWAMKKSAIFFPAELQILAQRADGIINTYTMNLDDFFATSWMIPHLSLMHSWGGPRGSVKILFRHPNKNFVASVGMDGEVVVYQSSVPQVGLRTTDGLQVIASFPPDGDHTRTRNVAWLPHGLHLVVEEAGILMLYRIHAAGKTKLRELEGYDSTCLLLLLRAYYDAEANEKNAVHIVGIGTENIVFVWAVEFNASDAVEAALISKSRLEHSIIRASPTDDLCSTFYPDSPVGAHVFLTFSEENIVRFWHTGNGSLASLASSDTQPWRVVAEFEVNEVAELVETDAFGKLAIVSVKDGSRQLVIWGNEATGLEMSEEWRVSLSDTAIGMDWYISSDGQHLLAVAMPNRVHVYCQQRLARVEDMPSWTIISSIELPWTDTVSAVSWLTNGSLAVATGQKISVYEKWLEEDEAGPSARDDDATPRHMFSVVDETNGRMPDHHPQLLVQYLLWGKFNLARYSLSLLYHFVKRMVESGRVISATPMPLWKIFADDEPQTQGGQQYDALFDFGEDDSQKEVKVGEFGDEQAAYLSEQLAKISLPGITNVEQMSLLAVIDTLVQVEKEKRSLDENGVRYVLALRLFLFSQKSFPSHLKPNGLMSRDITWAYFSDSQDILLDFINQSFNNKLIWRDAKALGIGFWLRNADTLRRTVETMARNQYMGPNESRDPVDCSLFYMALKKKNVLLGLWKLANAHPEQAAMLKFLANDFEIDRWKSAALKNAFALLGKQRYEYAVTFFLLADKLKDAMNVCLKQLNDPQLAIVICRLYEGEDGPIQRETLLNSILPRAIDQGDRWLASVAFTMLKQRDKALLATLTPLDTLLPPSDEVQTSPDQSSKPRSLSDPTLLVFYHHLRRSYRSMRISQPRIPPDLECEFVYRSAQAYERLGCPGLALDIVRKAEELVGLYVTDEETAPVVCKPPSDDVAVGILDIDKWGTGIKTSEIKSEESASKETAGGMDWGETVSKPSAGDFDWGAPVSQQTSAGIDWGEPVNKTSADTFDWGAPVSNQTGGGIDWGEPTTGPTIKTSMDDEFEAFKRSLGGYQEKENTDLDLEEDDGDKNDLIPDVKSDGLEVSQIPIIPAKPIDEETLLRLELEKRNIRLYNWMLAMRVVQAAYKSASAVSKNRDVLNAESTFRDYFSLLQDGIRALCSLVEMPVAVMDQIWHSRCREMDAAVAYVELMPLHGTLADYKMEIGKFIVEESNTLARLSLGEGDLCGSAFIDSLSRQMLWFLVRWIERASAETQADSVLDKTVVSQAAATAFLTLTVYSIRKRKFTTLYWLVGFCDRFFDALLASNINDLKEIILEVLSDRPVTTNADAEDSDANVDSEPDDDDFEEECGASVLSHGDAMLVADALTTTVALQHVGLTFDGYLAQLRDDGTSSSRSTDDIHGFLCDAILRRLSRMLFNMQKAVARGWEKTAIRIPKVRKYLQDPDEKQIWDLLKRTVSIGKMLDLILQGGKSEETEGSTEKIIQSENTEGGESAEPKTQETQPELIYRTKDIIHTFALNPLDHNHMAIGTHRGIQEIDVENALHFFLRRGTFTDLRASVDDFELRATRQPPEHSFTPKFGVTGAVEKKGIKRQDTLTRNLSFDSMQKALKTNMHSLRRESSAALELDAGQRIAHNVTGVSSLASHPTLNYYLAGISEPPTIPAVVNLYQFGQPKELVTYTSGTTARFTRCRFDPFGSRFGASDTKGDLSLWRFDASAQALSPAAVLACHAVTNDFLFWKSSSLLATAGFSTSQMNVCLWDSLLPANKSRIKGFTVAEGGAYSLAYSARHELLFAGGKRGDIYVFDTRQRTLLDNFHGHEQTVKSLAIDDENNCLVSGSTGGDVKLWDLRTFQQTVGWNTVHQRLSIGDRQSGNSERAGLTYGVMQIEVVEDGIYTCGADGCVRRYRSGI